MSPRSNTNWNLYLFGDFRLCDPLGNPVELPTAKVEGLLAVLATHRDYGISREEAAEILWAGKPLEKQRGSLRQALSQLRECLGTESIYSDRAMLRISQQFPLKCDYDFSDLRDSGTFMPGHRGPWFEEVQLEQAIDRESEIVEGTHSLGQNFAQTLSWLAAADPRGMLAFCNSNSSLVNGIPNNQFRPILEAVGASDETIGWATYWKATITDDLQAVIDLLRMVLNECKRTNDTELASLASLELGRAYSRSGNREKALATCDIADSIAGRSGTKPARSRAARLRGTILSNWEFPLEGQDHLLLASELTDDLVARTHIQAIRFQFLAGLGKFEKAQKLLDSTRPIATGLGVYAIDLNLNYGEHLMALSWRRPDISINALEDFANTCYGYDCLQFAVYANELSASLLCSVGAKELAKQKLLTARRDRATCKMVTTPQESRVQRLPAVLRG